ncbi:unnamed protein product [Prorocentrum cordatum]|uniref:Serine hydrolase FSH domain-containing protein n=1 Tax=Prorocentrum cordatum TaxID=2364126 RepID=A0ABN9RWK5_9DINO|nr:unnamed protein product [Polarella glacialis]
MRRFFRSGTRIWWIGLCSWPRWFMPEEYVAELRDVLGSRPKIKVPAVLIHGECETDDDGSAPWRVKEWVEEQKRNASREDVQAHSHDPDASTTMTRPPFHGIFFPEGQGHELSMVGVEGETPTWEELVDWMLTSTPPVLCPSPPNGSVADLRSRCSSKSSVEGTSTPPNRPAKHFLYLHGFGDTDGEEREFVKDQLERVIAHQGYEHVRIHAPTYHPNGDIDATRLLSFIDGDLVKLAESLESDAGTASSGSNAVFSAVIGFSVGGYVAALLQERHPHLVDRVVLLAPAIDNYERNFKGQRSWFMPEEYVAELRDVLGSRPKIKVPAVLIHGECETDDDGSAPWRVKEWVEEQKRNASREDVQAHSHDPDASTTMTRPPFHGIFFPEGQGHELSMVGVEGETPTWEELVDWMLTSTPPVLCPSPPNGSVADLRSRCSSKSSVEGTSTPPNRPAKHFLYLHGFGDTDGEEREFVKDQLERVIAHQGYEHVRIHAPTYHPNGDIDATRLLSFIDGDLVKLAESLESDAGTVSSGSNAVFSAVIGFSVGGYVAALLQERHPHLVDRVVLLAPAIDNYERNFKGQSSWFMPEEYVSELRDVLGSRPKIKVPAVLIHGECETDDDGSAPWRVKEWVEEQKRNASREDVQAHSHDPDASTTMTRPPFHGIFFPEGQGHELSMVGVEGETPTWEELVDWMLTSTPPVLCPSPPNGSVADLRSRCSSKSSVEGTSTPPNRPAKHFLYLHGFGDTDGEEREFVKDQLERVIAHQGYEHVRIHAPTYHPNGDIDATRLLSFIDGDLVKLAESLESDAGTASSGSNAVFSAVIGFSVGGYVAALLQERHPHLVDRVVLLAPAIDNYERNFKGQSSWFMPEEYVSELRDVLGSRPKIKVPAVLIHGECETDDDGSAPWRVKEWVEEQKRNASREDVQAHSHDLDVSTTMTQPPFHGIFFPEGQGHELSMVGVEGKTPTWEELVSWMLKEQGITDQQ